MLCLGTLTKQSLIAGKRSTVEADSDEEEETIKPAKKRRVLESDDSDNENDVSASDSKSTPKANKSSAIKRPLPVTDTPSRSPKHQPKVAKKTPAKGKQSDDDDDDEPVVGEREALLKVDSLNKVWFHETINFLKPNQIKDKNMRKPTDPDYDPRTVFVPCDFIKKQTPGTRSSVHDCTIILPHFNFSNGPVVEVEIRLFRLHVLLQSRKILRAIPS